MENEMSFEELQEIVSLILDHMEILQAENADLKEQIARMNGTIHGIVQCEEVTARSLKKHSDALESQLMLINNGVSNVIYELNDPNRAQAAFFYPQFYPVEETIDRIVNEKCSLARFGDGEFAIMSGVARQKFQAYDERLARRLKEVIQTDEDGLLIAIADNYGSLEKYNMMGKQGIRAYMTENVRMEHAQFLNSARTYHNTYISRPYALFADNDTDAPAKRFQNLKRIWNDRQVIFIEGELTRLGVGNDLFDNAVSIRRILAPAVSAFDKYDEILKAALDAATPDVLFLVALGPTAKVLTYDLYHAGFQTVDIGHVDLEYEWFRNHEGGRCQVKGKYNNEMPDGDKVEDIYDEKYEREIICRI